MTDLEELILDLRTHAHEAPAVCAALMRRSASELERRQLVSLGDVAARLPARAPKERTSQCV